MPWAGERLQGLLDQFTNDPAALRAQLANWAQQWLGQLGNLVGGVAQNALKLGFAVLTVLFVYRDGESLLDQVRRVLRRFLGKRVDGYIAAIGITTKAVLYGLVLTALAQGALAGVGYWAAGVRAPVLFGAFTALVALMPFGTPFVWGAIGVWLLVAGKTLEGIGLLLWGALVVSWVDNLIRPLVISSATHIPFLLVMFGVHRRPRRFRPDRHVRRAGDCRGAAGAVARMAGRTGVGSPPARALNRQERLRTQQQRRSLQLSRPFIMRSGLYAITVSPF